MYEHKELLTNGLKDYYEPPNNIRDKIIIKPGFDNRPGFPDNRHDAYKAKIDAEYRETLEKGLNVVPNNKLSELYINELKHSIENKEIYK
jgi:hypothetical protein